MNPPTRPELYGMSMMRPATPSPVAPSRLSDVTAHGERVIFIGPFPPDIHGQAVSTLSLYNCLVRDGLAIYKVDVNTKEGKSLSGRLRRIWKHLQAATALLFGHRGGAYISVNANVGMWMTTALALLGRIRGRKLFLHHHTYAHFTRKIPAADWLFRIAGPRANHIMICQRMGEDLAQVYGRPARILTLSNIDAVDPTLSEMSGPTREIPTSLGHLSNLTAEKGIVRVIDAFRAAKSAGLAERLVVAGPCSDDAAKHAVAAAAKEFGSAFDYRGLVRGEAKRRFFADIDVFLFPSLYPNETEGIVALEALAAGKPVIAHGLCCIPRILNDPSCCVVPPTAPFTPAFLEFLAAVSANWPLFATGAKARFEALRKESQEEYTKLLIELRGGSAAT